MKLSEHFSDWELLSPQLLQRAKERNIPIIWFVMPIWIEVLELIRTHFNKPVYVNKGTNLRRGVCTEVECIDAGRTFEMDDGSIVSLSQHNHNGAFDITVADTSACEVGRYIEGISGKYGIGGLGVNHKQNFTHLDFRNSKTLIRWEY